MYSLNEISSTLKKAALGAGFDVGRAEEIAAAGCWLLRHGEQGPKTVLDAIADGPRPICFDNSKATFSNVHIASCGLAAIDLLSTGQLSELHFDRIDQPALLCGLAGVNCVANQRAYHLLKNDLCVCTVSTRGLLQKTRFDDMQNTGWTLVMAPQEEASISLKSPQQSSVFDVEDQTWKSLLTLGHRTYVPASESSRLTGAGAGLVDND